MISVTQPRRKPADDFLSTLQANLQGHGNRRVRRKGQGNPVAVTKKETQKPPVQRNAARRPKPDAPKNKTKQENVNQKKVAGGPSVVAPNKIDPVQITENTPNTQPDIPPQPDIPLQPEILISPTQQQHLQQQQQQQTFPQPPISQYIEYTQPNIPVNTEPVQQQSALRNSQNNFYFKNKSNIFDVGYNEAPVVKRPSYQQPVINQSIVDNAIRIASQQPLPPTPSFSKQHVGDVTSHTGHMMTSPSAGGEKPPNSHYSQSFSISGRVDESDKSAKELERRKWIQELEKQISEKKERERQEKTVGWGSPAQNPSPFQRNVAPSYQATQMQQQQHTMMHQHQQHNMMHQQQPQIFQQSQQYPQPQQLQQQPQQLQQQPQQLQQQPQQLQQPPQNLHQQSQILLQSPMMPANPPTTLPLNQTAFVQQLSPQHQSYQPLLLPGQQSPQAAPTPTAGYMLGQNRPGVDPLELERRQEARRKALENQEMIKKQVEERERKKKEEAEQMKREEEREMRRIDEEKKRMAREVQEEQEKARKKEEAQMAQIQAMQRKIEEANKSAMEEKFKQKRHRTPAPTADPEPQEKVNKKLSRTPEPVLQSSVAVDSQIVEKSQGTEIRGPPVRQDAVRYLSNAATQTVNEVSCQTYDQESMSRDQQYMSRDQQRGWSPSVLPSESKLISLQDRELSTVQRNPPKTKSANQNPERKQTNSKRDNKPVFKPKKRETQPQKKALYDKNGRRIKSSPKPVTPPDITTEDSVEEIKYMSVAEIFDDPKPITTEEKREYSLPDEQIQMRYVSPQNEGRSIPSAISGRQNEILNQLEKLRLGLRDRRRTFTSDCQE